VNVVKRTCDESCAGRVNTRRLRLADTRICGAGAETRTILRSGRVLVELAAGRVRVVPGAGVGRARVEKFFVRVTEC